MASPQEIIVIGGGLIGLAIAWELKQAGVDANVKVLSRNFKESAGHAAAGMLAPQAEALPIGSPLFELCIQSRSLYPDWVDQLESYTGLKTNYWPCGILAPIYQAVPENTTVTATDPRCPAQWLSPDEIPQVQAGLSERVVGAWWFPADAQVDNRALMHCLWMACTQAGVEILDQVTVHQIHTQGDRILELETSIGSQTADHYILATGAWVQELFPAIPVFPRKGQMLALDRPDGLEDELPLSLRTVLFAPDIYIVPRSSGRIVLGATSEDVGFAPSNTPAGIQSLLQAATQLLPDLAHYSIQELWWGYRPTPVDELPILGESPYANLTLATGHHRNGVLLAPITAAVIKDWVLHQRAHESLPFFQLSRFVH